MDRFVVALSRMLAVLASGAIVAMVLAIAADVVVRNATGASLPGMIEIAETSLLVSVFFGLAWAGVKGEHVAVTLLTDRFSDKWRGVTSVFVWATATLFLAWALYATALRAIDSTKSGETRFGIVRWPMYPMRWVVVIGLAAILLLAVVNLSKALAGKSKIGPASELEAALAHEDDLAAFKQHGDQLTAPDEAPVVVRSEMTARQSADAPKGAK